MKNIKVQTKYLVIPILLIFILSLGIVSASSIDTDDSSDIGSIISEDPNEISVMDSVEIGEDSSSNVLNDESDDEVTEKTFSELQTEIGNAEENGTIQLSGTYFGSEYLTVNKSLTFVGKGDKAIIKSDKFGDIFNIPYSEPPVVEYLNFENIKFISNSTNMKSWISTDYPFLYFEDCIFENIAVASLFADVEVNNCQFIHSTLGLDHAWGTIDISNFTKDSFIRVSNMALANIYNCNFEDGNDSAIWTYSCDAYIINCTIKNYTSQNGAAIFADGVNKIINCVFINNVATEYGGAIYFNPWSGGTTIENCSFINNSAKYGSAIAWNSSDKTIITNCIFDNNNPVASTLYFINDCLPKIDFSKLNITANNNFWG